MLLALKVVAEGHTKILGAVCDLKALTVKEIVGLSAVSLAWRDAQHRTLLCVEAHMPPGFLVLKSG